MTFSHFFWFIIFAIIALLWWRTHEIKQIAYRLAKRHCSEMEVQFLDDSIVLRRIRLKRLTNGQISLLRVFHFEFATIGDARYQGEVIFNGFKLHSIELEPYRF